MKSFTVKSYWDAYKTLPVDIQNQAEKKYELWKLNPFYPSLKFKCVNSKENIWSVRINMNYRALAAKNGNDVIWYWIGDHNKYVQMLSSP